MNPLKRELILYLILLAAFSPPFLSVSLLSSLNPLPPFLSLSLNSFSPFPLFLLLFLTLFSEGSVSKSSCRAAEGEAGKDEASRNDSVCVCVYVRKRWLSEEGKCEES